jgi:hypothetical protein
VKIGEMIKSLFRRQPPSTREELVARAEAERQRDRAREEAMFEAEKLRTVNQVQNPPPF